MLAVVWLAAADRKAVTAAAGRLDAVLATDPLQFGESQDSTVNRIGYERPLGIEYEVVEDDRKVIVQAVFAVG
jgi:hypothetical protein